MCLQIDSLILTYGFTYCIFRAQRGGINLDYFSVIKLFPTNAMLYFPV